MNKAKTLSNLNLKHSVIPRLKIYSVNAFLKKKFTIIDNIKKKFKNKKIAIRSSHIKEDGKKLSNAGKYSSFLNINSNDHKNIENKINLVIHSYRKSFKNNIFFVQEMVRDIKLSGVVLTKDINNYSDCYVINYHKGKDTTVVTSGKKQSQSIRYIKNKKYLLKKPFDKLIASVNEIEKKFKFALDIEFVIDKKNTIYIVQVRKLNALNDKFKNNFKKEIAYKNLEKKIIKLQQPHYNLFGNKNFFGVMPDWNPAEIIGKKPRPLALSLYQELITNHIWSENRRDYGYQNLKEFHLMTTFFGTPYIDIRIDFNSWLPDKLSSTIKKKLTNFYLNKFERNFSSHDKIERDIIFTSFNFSTKNKIKKDLIKILSSKEISELVHSLKEINRLAIFKSQKDFMKIKKLIKVQSKIENSNLYLIDKIYWHVEECKALGTLPFAGLARCGFIAIDLLDSLVREKIFSKKDKSNFMESLNTISSKINIDYKKLTKKNFINKYGHLRPNTYEITSNNYKENFNKYFGNKFTDFRKRKKFLLNKIQKISIYKLLERNKIYKSPEQLLEFMKTSIEHREYAKFIFSKSIDLIFKNIMGFGKKYYFTRDDLSYLKIDYFLDSYFNLSSEIFKVNLKNNLANNKKEYIKNSRIPLPDVILGPKDVYVQNIDASTGNYVTESQVTSKLFYLSKKNDYRKLKNSIVCIESADPGYDFIFSHGIKGLITKYGGYNSHMAIRCSELNIPAVIGLGEKKFSLLKNVNTVQIDCKNKKINFL